MAEAGLSLSSFEPLVGSRFTLQLSDADELPTRLIEARASRHGEGGGTPPFSLTFEAPAEPALPQRTYRMSHAELGSLEIFLVPIARSATGLQYEAVYG